MKLRKHQISALLVWLAARGSSARYAEVMEAWVKRSSKLYSEPLTLDSDELAVAQVLEVVK